MKKPTITRVQAINLKTKALDVALSPLTAILGENGTGKSSVREAIMLSVLGYSPALGKRAAGSLLRVGAKRLDIKATLSDGVTINRRWEQGRSLAASLDGPDLSESISPAQLDFSVFANAKPTDRQRILESLIVSTAPSEIAAEARKMIADGKLDITIDEKAEGWLGQLETDGKEAAKFARQEANTAAATILTLSAAEEPLTVSAYELTAAKIRLDEATQAEAKARAAFDAIEERFKHSPEKPDGEPVTAATVAEAHGKAEAARIAYEAVRDKLNERAAAAREAEAIVKPYKDSTLEANEHAAEDLTGDLSGELTVAETAARDAGRELDRIVDRKNIALFTLQKSRESWEELEKSGCCPTCGTAGAKLAESLKSLFDPKIAEQEKTVADIERELTAAQAVLTKADEDRARCANRLRMAVEREIFLARKRGDEVLAAAPAKPAEDVNELLTTYQTASTAHRTLQNNASSWEEWNRADIPSDTAIASARSAWETADSLKTLATEASNALAKSKTDYDQYLAGRRRIAELETLVEESGEKETAAKKLAAWAKDKSLSLTVDAMKPLLGLCNLVCAGILSGPVTIAGTDIGVETPDGMVALETLSGAEAVALGGAIQIAIAKTSPLPIVVIDELNRFAGKKHTRFIENLAEVLKAGHVEQIIVIDTPVTGTGPLVGSLGGTVVTMD